MPRIVDQKATESLSESIESASGSAPNQNGRIANSGAAESDEKPTVILLRNPEGVEVCSKAAFRGLAARSAATAHQL